MFGQTYSTSTYYCLLLWFGGQLCLSPHFFGLQEANLTIFSFIYIYLFICWVTPSWRTLRRSSLSWHLPSFSLLERRGQRLNWSQWRRSGGINCSLGLPGGWIQERMAPLDWEIRTSISFILFVLYSHSIVNLCPLPLSKYFEFRKSIKLNLLNILIWKSIKLFIFNFRYFEMLSLLMSTSTKQDAPT